MKIRKIEDLDNRSEAYQFDLEQDVPWDQISSPGLYLSHSFLKRLGFNVDLLIRYPEAMEACQWSMALAIAESFVHLEYDVLDFVSHTHAGPVTSRSTELLADEERKHIDMFQRFSVKLRTDRPDLVRLFDTAYRAPESFSLLQKQADRYSVEEYQWLFWLTTVFFEECTIYICNCLEKEKQTIQPTWLAAHRCHRREEAQHILTDAANLELLRLSSDRKQILAALFAGFLKNNICEIFSTDTWARLQEQLYPGIEFLPTQLSFRDMGIYQDLRRLPVFRFTRHYMPVLLREPLTDRLSVTGQIDEDTLIIRFQRAVQGEREIIFKLNPASESRITYRDLFDESEIILSALQARGIRSGESVVLWLNHPQQILPAFWGCVLGGFIPVILTPSLFINDEQEEVSRLWRVVQLTQSPIVIVDDAVKPQLIDVSSNKGNTVTSIVGILQLTCFHGATAVISRPKADDIAMVQFSSGTMGAPRGAALSHRNLISVANAMIDARGGSSDDVFVNWLPLSHDMGLIGFHLTPLVINATQVHMPTYEFVKRPSEWFRCLHDYKATVTAGTTSSITRLLSRVKPDFIRDLDLSKLHSFIVGAETVSDVVLRELIDACKPAGLCAESICPAYGLAEAALAVTMTPQGEEFRTGEFSRSHLTNGRADIATTKEDTVTLVELGTPVKGTSVRIVNEENRVVNENTVGCIQVSGPSVMTSYFRDEAATKKVVQDGWLNTGDKGFLVKDRLYFVGRDQDAFVVRGQNFYASDIEHIAAEAMPRASDEVVLVVDSSASGINSKLLLFIVTKAESVGAMQTICDTIRDHVQRRMGISVDKIIRARRKEIPRTTSGKIAKDQLLCKYHSGQFAGDTLHRVRVSTDRECERETPTESNQNFWRNVVVSVRQIWADVLLLPVSDIELDSDFRLLGGDSLKAAEVLVRLETASGLSFPIELLVQGVTVRRMAAYVQNEAERKAILPTDNARQETPQSRDYANELARMSQSSTGSNSTEAMPGKDSELAPIAVIGIGLRFPGGRTQDEFWKLLIEGRDAFQVTPIGRRQGPVWKDAHQPPPRRNDRGTYLNDLSLFDPDTFCIPDEEAKFIDPQQRLFLEVCLEALDQAAIVDKCVGVFAASGDNEYGLRYLGDVSKLGRYSLLGGLRNMIAARVAQVFRLTGPALAVDTACSGSATAVHLACDSLRNGECAMALAGGVQLNLSNQVRAYFEHAGVLSTDGICRPFDRDAAGLVPGEGAGVVLLKPLDQASADGDYVIGVIRSSALNNDGGGLSGTAPSTIGQRDVIESAYARAGISPSTISYLEAHAAGTMVGDAVEVRSVTEALSGLPGRIPIGSVKSNIGHTLATAGIAGLIKVLLCLEHKQLVPTLGCRNPAERIGFDTTPLYPLTEAKAWTTEGGIIRRAGINSFGLGGTNVHIVVEEKPPCHHQPFTIETPDIFCLSATTGRMANAAEFYRRYIATSRDSLEDICATSMTRGQLFTDRHAFVVNSKQDLLRCLGKLTSESIQLETHQGLIAFICPGGGSAVAGATRYLLDKEPAFRNAWRACASHLYSLGLDLDASLCRSTTAPQSLMISQALVFSFSVAAARWLAHLGVIPDMVIGHSIGEYAAAHIAGMITLEDALFVLIQRAHLMELSAPGQMIVVFAPESQIEGVLGSNGPRVDVAARNAPEQIVLSGHSVDIQTASDMLARCGITTQTLPVNCGAHSSTMAPLKDRLISTFDNITLSEATIPFISTVEGAALQTTDALYWAKHLSAPVEFSSAVQYAATHGTGSMIELNGAASLSACVQAICSHNQSSINSLSLVKSDPQGNISLLDSMVDLVNAGIRVQLARTHLSRGVAHSALPPYPYQRQTHWIDVAERSDCAQKQPVFGLEESAIRDHRVAGVATAPLAWIVDQALMTVAGISDEPQELQKIVLAKGFVIHDGEERVLNIAKSTTDKSNVLLVRSAGTSSHEWIDHMQCSMRPLRPRIYSRIDLHSIAEQCPEIVSAESVYDLLGQNGLEIGSSMRSVVSVQVGQDELLVRLKSPSGATVGNYVDPCLLDGASHAVAAFALRHPEQLSGLFVGLSIQSLRVFASVHESAMAYVRLHSAMDKAAESLRYDIILASEKGDVWFQAEDFVAKRIKHSEGSRPILQKMRVPVDSLVPNGFLGGETPHDAIGKDEKVGTVSSRIQLSSLSQRIVARYLGIAPEDVSQQCRFAELGVDSLMAVQIALELERQLGVSLHSALLFEANNLFELGGVLAEKLRHKRNTQV